MLLLKNVEADRNVDVVCAQGVVGSLKVTAADGHPTKDLAIDVRHTLHDFCAAVPVGEDIYRLWGVRADTPFTVKVLAEGKTEVTKSFTLARIGRTSSRSCWRTRSDHGAADPRPGPIGGATAMRHRKMGLAALAICMALASSASSFPDEADAGQLDRPLPPSVGFDRHVEGLITRLGCNAGTCHGSARGRGGLKLSLFVADPGAISRLSSTAVGSTPTAPRRASSSGRPPTASATAEGVEWSPVRGNTACCYAGLSRAQARADRAAARLEITPRELRLAGRDGAAFLSVTAEFVDGYREEVTRFCSFRSGDDELAEVDGVGHVYARRTGATAAVAGYGGAWAAATVLIPHPCHPASRTPRCPLRTPSTDWSWSGCGH